MEKLFYSWLESLTEDQYNSFHFIEMEKIMHPRGEINEFCKNRLIELEERKENDKMVNRKLRRLWEQTLI